MKRALPWTETTRPHYAGRDLRYVRLMRMGFDLPPAKSRGRPQALVDKALLQIATTGCQWRQLPEDFPAYGQLYPSLCHIFADAGYSAAYQVGSAGDRHHQTMLLVRTNGPIPNVPGSYFLGKYPLRGKIKLRIGDLAIHEAGSFCFLISTTRTRMRAFTLDLPIKLKQVR